jgi:hypothetical protein
MNKGKSPKNVIEEAQKLTFGPPGKRYTPCPYGCGPVRAHKFAKHLRNAHTWKGFLLSKRRGTKVRETKSTDALLHSVSGGRPESSRRKH